MEPYQERIVEEKKALDEKIAKLETFTGTETFSKLGEEDTMLLLRQKVAMETYSDILGKRIARFK